MKELRKSLIEETKKKVSESFDNEKLIIQTSRNLAELEKYIQSMKSRLKEWYSYYNHEVEDILQPPKNKSSLGADFSKEDLDIIKANLEQIKNLIKLKENNLKYLESLMKNKVPNLLETTGTEIGAKLIDSAKGIKQLASMPSTKIQILGAEKALFRHLKEGAKPPKYGIIYFHELIQEAEDKGKAARKLAAEISKAIRIDYFRK